MSMSKEAREAIVQKLLEQIWTNPQKFSAYEFARTENMTPQSVYRYLRQLENDGRITKVRSGRKNVYTLTEKTDMFSLPLAGLMEDIVWKQRVAPFFSDLPSVPKDNLSLAFTEILNNAIDHSAGETVSIEMMKNGSIARVLISDDGVGIFTKIADAMGLAEKSFAILELAKGKFTTDPESHTGEGVFFSSRVMDGFAIVSDGLVFLGAGSDGVEYLTNGVTSGQGTSVLMEICYDHTQTAKEVFDYFTQAPEDYGFSKTIVPVRLLEYGDEKPLVVSRSQAKRLMVRFDRFQNIILDFTGIDEIGQGFADELFRVFPRQHPQTKLYPKNCSDAVLQMINRVTGPNQLMTD